MKRKKRLPGGVKFLLGVLTLYIVVWAFDVSFAASALKKFWQTFVNILPILVLAFFVMFLVELFVKKEFIQKHLGHDSGAKGIFWALLASFVISGPPYILFPYFKQLKDHGLRTALAAIFFNNRSMQPVFLPVLVHYFGVAFSVVLFCYVTIFAVFSGLLVEKISFLFSEKKLK